MVRLAADLDLAPSFARSDPRWTWLALQLRSAVADERLGADPLIADPLALEIFGLAARRLPDADERAWLPKFQQWLNDRPEQRYSLADLADQLGLHPVTLTRGIRSIYRCTIGELLRAQQVSKAQRLLASTDLPLVEIAIESGFCDQSHMNRAFAKVLGATPKAFRNAVR